MRPAASPPIKEPSGSFFCARVLRLVKGSKYGHLERLAVYVDCLNKWLTRWLTRWLTQCANDPVVKCQSGAFKHGAD